MIRIRHPQGVSTLKLDPSLTLSELQSKILDLTGIPPNDQELKTGYPPRTISLHDVPQGHLVSEPPLGISKGEQLLVSQRKGASSAGRGEASSGSSSILGPASTPTQTAQTPAAKSVQPSLVAPSSSSSASSQPKPPSKDSASTPSKPLLPPPTASQPTTSSSSSTSNSAPLQPVQDGEVHVDYQGSSLTLKVVPDDNSCLFASIALITEQRIDSEVCGKLRKTVADIISSSPQEWSEAILGHPPPVYVSKILSSKTWGGAIELSILSRHLRIQIHAIDVASGVIHRFGEDVEGAEMKGFVVYSGIHYDALSLLPTPEAPLEFGTTLFPSQGTESQSSEAAALRLVAELKKRRYYTDTSSFALRCNACGTRLEGEKQAQEHAMKTGHADFGEV